MVLSDGTVRKVPVARIYVETPYLTGIVEAQCLPHAIYDLVVGNVPGARAADDPSHSEETDTNKGSAEEPLKSPKNAAPNLGERMKKMEAEIKVMQQKLVEVIKGSESVEVIT